MRHWSARVQASYRQRSRLANVLILNRDYGWRGRVAAMTEGQAQAMALQAAARAALPKRLYQPRVTVREIKRRGVAG